MSRKKICQGLGLEPLRLRRWYRKLCLSYRVFKNEHPQYLFHSIPVGHSSHTSRNIYSIPFLSVKHSFFKSCFFPSAIAEWNKLDPVIRNSESLSIFRKNIIHFIRPAPILFTIVIILKELNLLSNFDLAWVT